MKAAIGLGSLRVQSGIAVYLVASIVTGSPLYSALEVRVENTVQFKSIGKSQTYVMLRADPLNLRRCKESYGISQRKGQIVVSTCI